MLATSSQRLAFSLGGSEPGSVSGDGRPFHMNSIATMPIGSGELERRIQLRWPRVLSRVGLTIICLLCVAMLGYFDYVTGSEQSLLLFYLLPISLATWFEGLGFGLLFSAISIVAWIGSDIVAGIPTVRVWNVAMAT